jgi:hypothetical protein
MKPILIVAALMLVTSAAPTTGLAQKRKTASHTLSGLDQNYVLALTAADQFLYAWATRNMEDGLALLSPQLKAKYPEEYFRYYISGISDPHHQAFEVGEGKRLPSGGFAFPVTLYEHYTGQKESFAHPKPLTIVIIQTAPESWLVNELPGFVEPEPKNP